jgi:sugar phosphate isomerase/epimerase
MSNSLIAFSTLACPEWGIRTIISKAKEFGYGGVEWRGGPQGHVNPQMAPAQIEALCKRMEDDGLVSLAITAYTAFASPDLQIRQSNLDELKSYLDLAAETGAGYVRTFLGELPAGMSRSAAYPFILDCLEEAVEYANSCGVTIAVEPHDDFVLAASIDPLLRQIAHPNLRVIWDFGNAYSAGEEPGSGFDLLKGRIAYVQVKDGRGRGQNWRLCPVGQGEVPLSKITGLLLAAGYEGAFSIEWERAWHPELDPPDVALPAARQTLSKLLAERQPPAADSAPNPTIDITMPQGKPL